MKNINNFFDNRNGSLSIEFAGCFCLFIVLLFIIYDIYSSITLQSRLERVNYTVASLFRERSELYPLIDDTQGGGGLNLSLCAQNPNSCFKTYELFNKAQINELSQLASSMLNRDVTVRVDGLYILQDTNNLANLSQAQQVTLNENSCLSGVCDEQIDQYFTNLPAMVMNNNLDPLKSDYAKMVPYVSRGAAGRWIPLYRVSMCINNADSLYLRWINSDRNEGHFLPNLCSNLVVLSRCNDLQSTSVGCPIYY